MESHRPTKYSNVKNAHIVPRTYLENWADDGWIGVVVLASGKRLRLLTENVGTRRRFYRRVRPDGTVIDDVESSLGEGEQMVTPILRSFADAWPLAQDEKTMLAELFAYQLLRGPRWKDEYEDRTRAIFDQYRRDPNEALTREQLDDFERAFSTDSYRFIRMFTAAPTITSVLASTHWTLLDFHSRVIATSDHPVVLWPGATARPPQATAITEAGLLECLEIRLPLSPHHAVLMTWSDLKVDERVRAHRDDAANLNAFTIAQADEQWFHEPDHLPPITSGSLLPIATRLVPGYTPEHAAASRRRAATSAYAHSQVGRDLHDREIVVFAP